MHRADATTWGIRGYIARNLYVRLLSRIKSSCREGDRLESQVTLAKRYKVSVQTAQRVLGVLAQQGWVVRSRRSGTFVSKSPALGRNVLFVTGISREQLIHIPFYRDLLLHVAMAAADVGMALSVADMARLDGGKSRAGRDAPPSGPDLGEMDGMLALNPPKVAPMTVFAEHKPVVLIDSMFDSAPFSSARFDCTGALREIVHRLYSLGHQRIGFWGQLQEGAGHAESLYEAYLRVVASSGLAPKRDWIWSSETPGGFGPAAEKLAGIAAAERPTAVFVRGSVWSAIRELARRGMDVPADVSVVSLGRGGRRAASGGLAWEHRGYSADVMADDPPAPRVVDGQDELGLRPDALVCDVARLAAEAVDELRRRWTDATARCRTILVPMQVKKGNTIAPASRVK